MVESSIERPERLEKVGGCSSDSQNPASFISLTDLPENMGRIQSVVIRRFRSTGYHNIQDIIQQTTELALSRGLLSNLLQWKQINGLSIDAYRAIFRSRTDHPEWLCRPHGLGTEPDSALDRAIEAPQVEPEDADVFSQEEMGFAKKLALETPWQRLRRDKTTRRLLGTTPMTLEEQAAYDA